MAILPSNNISIMLVRNTLGYPSTDLGTLCSCDKINKWSKKKPVNYNFTFNRPTDWYKGSTGNYGLNIPTITLDLIGNSIITYDKPKGGETSPYRLGDFAGYFHNAPNAVEFSYPDKLYSNSGSANFYLLMNFDNTNAVTLRDIFNLDSADWYFGVKIKVGSTVKYKTAVNPFNRNFTTDYDNISITLTDSSLSAFRQNFQAAPFICTAPLTSWGQFNTVMSIKGLDNGFENISVETYSPPVGFNVSMEATMPNAAMINLICTVTNTYNQTLYFPFGEGGTKINKSGQTQTIYPIWTIIDAYPNGIPVGATQRARCSISGGTQVGDYSAVLRLTYMNPIDSIWIEGASCYAEYVDPSGGNNRPIG